LIPNTPKAFDEALTLLYIRASLARRFGRSLLVHTTSYRDNVEKRKRFCMKKSIVAVIIFSMLLQLLALPVLFWGKSESKGAAA
jgi:hypothetical protein